MLTLKHFWLQWKRRYLSAPLAVVGMWLLRWLLYTCRIEILGLDTFASVASAGKCILTIWHNRLLVLPELLHRNGPRFRYCTLISNSRDGEPLALWVQRYPEAQVIRVPHDAKHHALQTCIERLQQHNEILVITPDGPQGPRYSLKPGFLLAAREAQAPILPVSWSCSRFWQLNSWDKLLIPKPFSRIVVVFGELHSPPPTSERKFTSFLNILKEKLLQLDAITCSKITPHPSSWPK